MINTQPLPLPAVDVEWHIDIMHEFCGMPFAGLKAKSISVQATWPGFIKEDTLHEIADQFDGIFSGLTVIGKAAMTR